MADTGIASFKELEHRPPLFLLESLDLSEQTNLKLETLQPEALKTETKTRNPKPETRNPNPNL